MSTRTPTWRGTNVVRVAGFNVTVLVDAIRRSPAGLSRVELSATTGLSPQAVSNITRRALDSGLLVEGERQQPQGMGKPRTPLLLNPAGAYAVGVHLDPRTLTYALLDLTGTVVAHRRHPLELAAGPADVLAAVSGEIDKLVTDSGVDRDRVTGVGFAAPGPVDLAAGRVVAPPHLPAWIDVPLRDELSRLTGMPVLLDKDVVAAAIGERWAGATMDHANSVFVYLSTGVGTGVVADGVVLRGATGNAGDIGHLVVASDGPLCECGMRGCLGIMLSPRGIVTQAVDHGALQRPVPTDVDELDAALGELVRRHEDGDTTATAVVERSAAHLARAAGALANLLDTDVVAFGGPTWARLGAAWSPLLPGLLDGRIARGDLAPLEIVGSALGQDVAAAGAACLVLDNAFMPRAGAFVLG